MLGFPGPSNGKESACNAVDPGLTLVSVRSPGAGSERTTHSSILGWRIPGT